MPIQNPPHGSTTSPRPPRSDDPDQRPSAPPPPDVPDRSDPPEPLDRPTAPPGQPPRVARRSDVLLSIARLEADALRLRHFTVLDALLRLKRRVLRIRANQFSRTSLSDVVAD